MINDYEFYKIRDYDRSIYERFYQNRAYMKLRDEIKTIIVYSAFPGLGDLILLSPFFKTLRNAFPEAKLSFLGLLDPSLKTLFGAIPDIDEYLPYSPIYGFHGTLSWYHLYKLYRNKRFDLVIDTQRQFVPSLMATRILKARYRVGYTSRCLFSNWKFSEPNRDKIHILAQLMMLLRALGIEDCSYKPRINISKKYPTVIDEYLANHKSDENLIGIIPGAGNREKCWPANFFAEVGNYLAKEFKSKILLFGGGGEEDILSNVADLMKETPIIPILENRLFLDDLMYSAALMRKCSFIIGNDCGGTHLATAVGTPVIVIYGPTQPTKFGPLGEKNIVINHKLSCSPCKKGHCPIDRRCLKEIEPGEVISAAEFLVDAVADM